jgi:hypothetical protein
MRKYFYTDGKTEFGPFLLEELKEKDLKRDTKVWYFGLSTWTTISELEELEEVVKTIPPPISSNPNHGIQPEFNVDKFIPIAKDYNTIKKKKSGILKLTLIVVGIGIALTLLGNYLRGANVEEVDLYQEIVDSSFDTEEDFSFYIDKFYRDTEAFGLYPKKPKKTIVKFAKLDQISGVTHFHGISFGLGKDDLIEIYINPSTWKKFNKPKRYYLIYHELAHDVLNVEDLSNSELNIGKLMYPEIASYERITMDDFIEASHELFEQISGQQNN